MPAGAFYSCWMTQWCRRTLLKRRKRTRSKKLRLSGVLLAESEVIRLMDEANPPYTLVKLLTKEGKVMAKDYLLSQESMNQLIVWR